MNKNIFGILAILVFVMAQGASAALNFNLDNSNVAVPIGGSTTVTLTALNNGVPVPNVALKVTEYCKETTAPVYSCNAGDQYSPSEVTVLTTSPTDVNGHATITITHDGSANYGQYHYTVCDVSQGTGTCGVGAANVTGDFYVPEFTTIGAGIVLVCAGLFIYKKRK